MRTLIKIKSLVFCNIFKQHNWTCAAEEGIPVSETQKALAKSGSMRAFYDYAKMYCKDCGHIYPRSLENLKEAK